MTSIRVRKQNSRRKLRGGTPIVYTCIFYEANGDIEGDPFDITLKEDDERNLNDFGLNDNQNAFNTDNEMLNKENPLRSQRDKIKNQTIIIRKFIILKYASPELRADKEVVLAAVKNSGAQLKYASPELRADKEVVLAAVNNTGYALQFASPELRADKEVVLAAVENKDFAIQFASDELKRDKDVIRISMKRPYAEGYNNINMEPRVGDYVTLAFKSPDPNPLIHRVTEIVPPESVRLNNTNTIYIRSLNFVPEKLVFKDRDFGLRLVDRTFTIRGGRKKRTKRFKK